MSINKRFLYGLSAFFILVYSLFSPFYKASALDNDKPSPLNTTKKLYVGGGLDSKSFKTDVTKHFSILLFSNRGEFDGHTIKWKCSAFNREQAFTSYKKAIANNSGWLITYSEGARTSYVNSYDTAVVPYNNVSIYFSESKPDEQLLKYSNGVYFLDFSSSVRPNTYLLNISYSYIDGTIDVGCSNSPSRAYLSENNLGVDPYWLKKGHFSKTSTYINTFPYRLDKDITWDVPPIPDSDIDALYPHFEYDLKYLKLKVHHLKEEDHILFPDAWASYDNKKGYYIPDKTGYYLQFTVQHKNGGEVIKNGLQYLPAGGSFDFELPALGEYVISAEYSVKVCYAYSYDRDKTIAPADGDYCFYTQPDETKLVKYGMRTVYVKADGTSKSGSTLSMNCVEGFCSDLPKKPKYEDCSVYDFVVGDFHIPSPGSIACSVRNAFIWFFTDFLFGILFPKIEDLQSLWNDLLNTIIDRLGFLALPFTFIKGVFTTVEAMNSNNTTCAVSLTIFGSTANLEMCRWRYQLPAVWSFMQIFLQGGIAIGFLWTCYRLANRFFGIYVEDYEEEDHDTHSIRWFDERTGDHGDWEERRKD